MVLLNNSDTSAWNESEASTATPPPILFVTVSSQLVTYVIPVLFGFGTVGNIMTISVLVRRGVTQSTTTFYLFVLSVSDLLCLYVGMPVFYFREVYTTNLRALSQVFCRLHTFLTYCVTHLVAWTIVAMQVDRTIWVALPFRARQLCTIRNARIIMLAIVVVILLFNNHFLWTLEVRVPETGGQPECTEIIAYQVFANHVVGLMDVGMFSLVPSAIMFVCNTVIMLKLRQFAKNRSRLLSSHTSASAATPACKSAQGENQRGRSASISHNTSSKERSLTIMLQTVSTFFIVTTLPVCAVNLAYAFAISSNEDAYSMTAMVFYGLQSVANLLAYLNISVQFILYFLSCKSFRTDVRDMIKTWLDSHCYASRSHDDADADVDHSTWAGALTSIAPSDHHERDLLTHSASASAQQSDAQEQPGNAAQPAAKSILKRANDGVQRGAPRTINVHT